MKHAENVDKYWNRYNIGVSPYNRGSGDPDEQNHDDEYRGQEPSEVPDFPPRPGQIYGSIRPEAIEQRNQKDIRICHPFPGVSPDDHDRYEILSQY